MSISAADAWCGTPVRGAALIEIDPRLRSCLRNLPWSLLSRFET